jgi:hypothetical protein
MLTLVLKKVARAVKSREPEEVRLDIPGRDSSSS